MQPEVTKEAESIAHYADNPETQIILDALMAKEPSEKLLELIQSEQVFIYCILTKCKKSLEHLKGTVDKYRKVFSSLYASAKSQKLIIDMVMAVFGPTENYEMRDKATKVIQKMCQIRVLSNQVVIEWALAAIQTKEHCSAELWLVLQALQRQSKLKWQTVTLYQQKPPVFDLSSIDGLLHPKMEVDERAEDTGIEKKMTLHEYHTEFNKHVASEQQVFDKTIRLL